MLYVATRNEAAATKGPHLASDAGRSLRGANYNSPPSDRGRSNRNSPISPPGAQNGSSEKNVHSPVPRLVRPTDTLLKSHTASIHYLLMALHPSGRANSPGRKRNGFRVWRGGPPEDGCVPGAGDFRIGTVNIGHVETSDTAGYSAWNGG